jgi:hypothetical protein
VIAEVSWDYHRGAKEPVFQVLKSWFISVGIKARLTVGRKPRIGH